MDILTFSTVIVLFGVVKCELTVHESFETARSRPSTSFIDGTDGSNHHHRSPRFKYREFAETEFHRPGYLPIPYVVGGVQNGDLRTMPIPSVDLSEIIRQHISHQRDKWMKSNETRQNLLPSTILEGVTHITEFRQTPFRRFPDSPPERTISYEEKRRRWKSELRRRLRGPKVPARQIVTDEQRDTTTTVAAGDYDASANNTADRYYVTYSPETRVYQVSRRPPMNLEPSVEETPIETTTTTTTRDPFTTLAPIILPTDGSSVDVEDQSYEIVDKPAATEPTESEEETTTTETIPLESTEPPTFVRLETDDDEDSDEWGLPARGTPAEVKTTRDYLIVPSTVTSTTTTLEEQTTTTATTTTTTTTAAPTVVVREAETIPRNLTFFQQIRVVPERPAVVVEQEFRTIKQILHLDDYYQEIDDEEDPQSSPDAGDSAAESTVPTPSSTTTTTTVVVPTLRGKSLFDVSDSDEEEEPSKIESPTTVRPTDRPMDHSESLPGTKTPHQLPPVPVTTPSSRGYEVHRLPTVRSNDEAAEPSENDEDDEDEDEDDDDLFFWRPEQSSQNRRAAQNTRYRDLPLNSDEQPFEIVTHRDVKRKI